MWKTWRYTSLCLTLVITVGLCSLAPTLAKKPGGGGGGGTNTTPYRVVELPHGAAGTDLSMNQLDPDSATTEVVGKGTDGRAHYWMLQDSPSDPVILDFPLSLPSGAAVSNAADINDEGLIVGLALLDDAPGAVRPIFWPDAFSDPVLLPVPDGFDGRAYAIAVNNSGIVVGYLAHPDGGLEFAAWQILEDEFGLHGSSPAHTPWQGWVGFDINDAGWVAATSTSSGVQQAQRFRLVWNGSDFTLTAGANLFAEGVASNTHAVNQAGAVAGARASADGTSTVFAMALDGTLLNLPTSIGRKQIHNAWVSAVNDTTAAHGVQVLAEVRTVDRSGYVYSPQWCIFEENGAVMVLDDAISLPADSPFDQIWASNMTGMNDAGWVCGQVTGRIQASEESVQFPAVLIRNP